MTGGMDKVEVTIACAAVEMVGLEPYAHELLEEIELFIGTASSDQTRYSVRSVLASDFGEPIHHMVHGFEPGSFNQLIAFAKERLLQPCGAIDVLEPKP